MNGMYKVELVLVRHGYSQSNKHHVFSGMTDVALTPEGIEQIEAYRAEGLYPATEKHFSSPLKRCLQTFRAAYGEQTKLDGVIDAFHEVSFGTLEGRSLDDDGMMHIWDSWLEGGSFAAGFGVEPYEHAKMRGSHAVANLAFACARHGVASATVVTHSAIMRASLMGLLGLDADGWSILHVPNGFGYSLDMNIDNNEVCLIKATSLDPHAGDDAELVPAGQCTFNVATDEWDSITKQDCAHGYL